MENDKVIIRKKQRNLLQESEFFPVIMQNFDLYGKHMSQQKFWKEYVQPMDPTVSYRMWTYFVQHTRERQKELVKKAIEKSDNIVLSEVKLENTSLKNALKIGHMTLESIVNNPELLMSIPIDDRMDWMFKAMKARDSRMNIALKKRGDDREQTMFESMMTGAQYGGIVEAEIPGDDYLPGIEPELTEETNETEE